MCCCTLQAKKFKPGGCLAASPAAPLCRPFASSRWAIAGLCNGAVPSTKYLSSLLILPHCARILFRLSRSCKKIKRETVETITRSGSLRRWGIPPFLSGFSPVTLVLWFSLASASSLIVTSSLVSASSRFSSSACPICRLHVAAPPSSPTTPSRTSQASTARAFLLPPSLLIARALCCFCLRLPLHRISSPSPVLLGLIHETDRDLVPVLP